MTKTDSKVKPLFTNTPKSLFLLSIRGKTGNQGNFQRLLAHLLVVDYI